jgi:hypothetical protein
MHIVIMKILQCNEIQDDWNKERLVAIYKEGNNSLCHNDTGIKHLKSRFQNV